MSLENYFPIWEKLTSAQQDKLNGCVIDKLFKKGESVLHREGGK